jgi:Winged helix DNA-binding domain
MTVRVSVAQRRGRLVQRQLLGLSGATVAEVTESLVALHATDPVTVYLSAWARSRCLMPDVDAALYAERSLVRMMGMRRTMFVVPAGLAGVVQEACTDDVAQRLRRRLEKELAGSGIGDGDPGGWLRAVEAGVLRALAARGGGASGAELAALEPRLRTQLAYAADKSYGGPVNITTRVLTLISAEGRMIRGHRRGGWTSGQFEWFLPEAWLDSGTDPGSGAGAAPDASEPLGAALGAGLGAGVARAELARRWLGVFGPAPASDLQWWAGWTGAQTKAALAALPVAEVDLDGQAGVVLADDLEFPQAVPTGAALLPGLDPTPMGWQARAWYLGPHAPLLTDRTGNIGPTVWWAGHVVGGWGQRASGEVVYRLLEDIGSDGTAAVSAETRKLEVWLGAARIKTRFSAPLERELTA